jgi:hypothetical protein
MNAHAGEDVGNRSENRSSERAIRNLPIIFK